MTNPVAPVYLQPGEYPKALYRSDTTFADEEGLKQALSPGGAVKTRLVEDEADEAAAIEAGWTATPTDFVGTAADPAPATKRAKKAPDA